MSASSLFPDLPANAPEGSGTSTSFGATQSLYRKYRPQTFDADELVGQEAIVRTLKNAIRLDRVAHAYLFTGPRGTGKTTTARLLAKAVNCLDPDPDARPCNACAACVAVNTGATTDIIEIDAASNRGIDDIRELRERVKFAPTFLKSKFYIVDEAHQITGAAANAFLKTLEEPPPHTKFILATTDPEQLLPTIVSRCQRFDFKRFSRATLVEHLGHIAEQEGVPIDAGALAVIGEHAGGSMRDALGLLDQLASYRDREGDAGDRPIGADDVRNLLGVARSERVLELAHALSEGDAGAGLALINAAFEAGEDPRQLNRQLVSLLRAVMFQVAAGSAGPDDDLNQLAQRFSLAAIARHAARFSEIDYRIRHSSLPQLPLEIAFVQAAMDGTNAPEARLSRSADREPAGQNAPARREAADRLPVSRNASGPLREERTRSNEVVQPPTMRAQLTSNGSGFKEESGAPFVASPESPTPITSMPSGEEAITVDLLHDLWPKIRMDVKARDRRIEALLSSCDPAAVNGSSITLVTNYKFHLEKMNEESSKELIQSVIGRLVNQPISVSTVMRGTEEAAPRLRAAESPSSQAIDSTRTAESSPAAELRTAEEQTIIEAAKNIFDAEELSPPL